VLRRRPHPRGDVIAYIWIGLFVAGFLVALFFQDDDPNTDEPAGVGALIFIAGTGLTVAYRAVGKRLNARNATGAGGEEDDVNAVPDTRRWVQRNLGPLGAGAAAVVALVLASALAPSPNTATPRAEPVHVQGKTDLAATIRAAASKASSDRRITSVDCINPVDVTDALLLTCAVTFEGPACQLWLAGGVDDPEPLALSDPADGRRGRADERMAHCE
jgi:hypothetical protein